MNSSPGRDAMLPLAFSQSLGGDDLRLSSAPSSGSTGPSSAPDQSIQSFAHIGDVNGRTTPLKLSNLGKRTLLKKKKEECLPHAF